MMASLYMSVLVGSRAVQFIPAGTTAPIHITLGIDGRGLTVGIAITDADGLPYATIPISWLDPAGGTALIFGVGSLPPGLYLIRYRLVDAAGRVHSVPNGAAPDRWLLVKP